MSKDVSKDKKQKIVASIPGVLLILAAAGLLTYGARWAVVEVTKPKPPVTKTVIVVKEDPKVVTPAPVTPTPVAAPAAPTATTNGFVHMRAGHSTATAIVVDLQAGTVVTLGSYVDSLWQQATYNGQTGYIYKRYLTY